MRSAHAGSMLSALPASVRWEAAHPWWRAPSSCCWHWDLNLCRLDIGVGSLHHRTCSAFPGRWLGRWLSTSVCSSSLVTKLDWLWPVVRVTELASGREVGSPAPSLSQVDPSFLVEWSQPVYGRWRWSIRVTSEMLMVTPRGLVDPPFHEFWLTLCQLCLGGPISDCSYLKSLLRGSGRWCPWRNSAQCLAGGLPPDAEELRLSLRSEVQLTTGPVLPILTSRLIWHRAPGSLLLRWI